jgi:hypothetical protein
MSEEECCKELWKDVVGFEGHYKVSNKGRIKSLKYGKETIRKLTKDSYGYLILVLTKNGERKHCKVHRLVAKAFLPNPKNLKTVNHKDFNKANNCVENLEWMTFVENIKHGVRNGKVTNGSDCHNAKLTENDVLDIICANRMFDIKATEFADAYDVHVSTIYQLLRGDIWKSIQI